MAQFYTFIKGSSPIVAAAIHDGHLMRNELRDLINLSDAERLREEDPFTAKWVTFTDNRIIVNHSRFETDVNRPPDKAVYRKPEDAWNLKVWKGELPLEMVNRSLAMYDQFYRQVSYFFNSLFEIHEKIVVYDIHTYNHRREAENKQANPMENPEINIGTININKHVWQPVIQTMTERFKAFDYYGRTLDVRENVKFKGGYFGKWLSNQYGDKICPVSIEFKKFFMDEWEGKPYEQDVEGILQLLVDSKSPVLDAIQDIKLHQVSYAESQTG